MTIANIIKPWSFVNNTETADATKVNQNFDAATSALNEVINALNLAEGTRASLNDRLSVLMNPDGTIKGGAIPVGTYDTRTVRVVTPADVLAGNGAVLETDSIIRCDTTDGDVNLSLPTAATAVVCPTILNAGATGNVVTITPDGTDTVMTVASVKLGVGGESIKLSPYGTNWDRIG